MKLVVKFVDYLIKLREEMACSKVHLYLMWLNLWFVSTFLSFFFSLSYFIRYLHFGLFQDDDVNLASSTLIGEGKCPSEAMGIVISYSLRVKLSCGTLGGELQTDVPFKLMNPDPCKCYRYLRNMVSKIQEPIHDLV